MCADERRRRRIGAGPGRAGLRGAELRGAELRGAELRADVTERPALRRTSRGDDSKAEHQGVRVCVRARACARRGVSLLCCFNVSSPPLSSSPSLPVPVTLLVALRPTGRAHLSRHGYPLGLEEMAEV